MQEGSRLDTALDGIRRMEYAFGEKHPNLARALDRYFKFLSDRGDQARIQAAIEMCGAKFAPANK